VSQSQGGHVRDVQRVKPAPEAFYIRGHTDRKLISRMLVNGGAAIN
jgi:hypothetical protein